MNEHTETINENTECRDCGCPLWQHNAVNECRGSLVAHCGVCGACWTEKNSPFVEALRQRLSKVNHEVVHDTAGWGRWPRYTCLSCDDATLVRQPYISTERWASLVEEFKAKHPAVLIRQLTEK